jgi:hypothetical protein
VGAGHRCEVVLRDGKLRLGKSFVIAAVQIRYGSPIASR